MDKREPTSTFEQLVADVELPDLSKDFRRLDRTAPIDFAKRCIRKAAEWLRVELEEEAEQLWNRSRSFREMTAAPLVLPAAYSSQYTALPLQLCSDMASEVAERIIGGRELECVAEALVALAILDLAQGEVGELEDEGKVRDPLLAKQIHKQIDLLQEEALAEHDVYRIHNEGSIEIERSMALDLDPDATVIEDWFGDWMPSEGDDDEDYAPPSFDDEDFSGWA